MKNFVKILEKIVEDCKEIFSLSLVKKNSDSDPHPNVPDPPHCLLRQRSDWKIFIQVNYTQQHQFQNISEIRGSDIYRKIVPNPNFYTPIL